MPNMVDLMKTAAMEAMEQSKPVSIHFGTVLNASPLQLM